MKERSFELNSSHRRERVRELRCAKRTKATLYSVKTNPRNHQHRLCDVTTCILKLLSVPSTEQRHQFHPSISMRAFFVQVPLRFLQHFTRLSITRLHQTQGYFTSQIYIVGYISVLFL